MGANPYAGIYRRASALGLDEDARRDLYQQQTGKRSLRVMTSGERGKVIAAMDRAGASRKPNNRLAGPFAGKLQALWIAAYNLGLVRDRRDGALLTWVKNQTGIDHTRFLTAAEDARKAVEGLKKMTARAGVDWSQGELQHAFLNDDRWRIVSAQWAILITANAMNATSAPSIAQFIEAETGIKELSKLTDRDWIAVMNALGVFVRKVKSAK